MEPPQLSYVTPQGQRLQAADARALARAIERGLPSVSDELQPLSDRPFGEEHTERRLAAASAGSAPADEDVAAARELLSGPPKAQAQELARFLQGGAVSICAGVRVRR